MIVRDLVVTLLDFLVIFTVLWLCKVINAPIFSIIFGLGYCWLRSKYNQYSEKIFLTETTELADKMYNEFCKETVSLSREQKFDQYSFIREYIISNIDSDKRKLKVLELMDKKFENDQYKVT